MSNPGTPAPPSTLAITGNPAIDGLILKGLMAGSAAIAGVILTWLNAHGFNDPNLNLMLSGAVLSVLAMVATAIWGFIKSRLDQAKAVNAGINLFASGGSVNVPVGMGLAIPVSATPASAQEIVKQFGDVKVAVKDEPALTEKLNENEIIPVTKSPQ